MSKDVCRRVSFNGVFLKCTHVAIGFRMLILLCDYPSARTYTLANHHFSNLCMLFCLNRQYCYVFEVLLICVLTRHGFVRCFVRVLEIGVICMACVVPYFTEYRNKVSGDQRFDRMLFVRHRTFRSRISVIGTYFISALRPFVVWAVRNFTYLLQGLI